MCIYTHAQLAAAADVSTTAVDVCCKIVMSLTLVPTHGCADHDGRWTVQAQQCPEGTAAAPDLGELSVTGPVCRNGLPDNLKSPDLSFDCFKRQLKTYLFCVY